MDSVLGIVQNLSFDLELKSKLSILCILVVKIRAFIPYISGTLGLFIPLQNRASDIFSWLGGIKVFMYLFELLYIIITRLFQYISIICACII